MLSVTWILWSNAFTRGLHRKGTKCSKRFSVTMSRRKHRSFGGALHLNVGKIVPQKITCAKMWTNLAKPPTTTEEVPFRRFLAFWASRRGHASKLGGRSWIFGRSPHSVSASVAGRKAEAAWPLQTTLCSHSRFNHLIWPLVISLYFKEWNSSYKGTVCRISVKCMKNFRTSYLWFYNFSSSGTSSSVRNGGPIP